jgi:uncharacterized membrane protein HdeD (DUF308 family)
MIVVRALLGLAGAIGIVAGCAIASRPSVVPAIVSALLGFALIVVGAWAMLAGLRS